MTNIMVEFSSREGASVLEAARRLGITPSSLCAVAALEWIRSQQDAGWHILKGIGTTVERGWDLRPWLTTHEALPPSNGEGAA